MKALLTTAALAATILALPACSGGDTANTVAVNETTLANDDFASSQENLTATDDLSGNTAEPLNGADAAANDTALNASVGNAL